MAKGEVTMAEKDWEAENAADSLLRAEEVKNKPALHKKALGILQKRQAALSEVEGIGESGAAIRKKRRHQVQTTNLIGG